MTDVEEVPSPVPGGVVEQAKRRMRTNNIDPWSAFSEPEPLPPGRRKFRVLVSSVQDEFGIDHYAEHTRLGKIRDGHLHPDTPPSDVFMSNVDWVRRFGPEKVEELDAEATVRNTVSGLTAAELRKLADEAEAREKAGPAKSIDQMTDEDLEKLLAKRKADKATAPAPTEKQAVPASHLEQGMDALKMMTNKELREYAEAEEIDLGSAQSKEQLIAAILVSKKAT